MPIIALSGKMSSGKDLVGKIIQYLSWCKNNLLKLNFEEWFYDKNNSLYLSQQDWELKKFAYAVKQIISIRTGIPITDLEDPKIKNSYWNLKNGEVYTLHEIPEKSLIVSNIEEYENYILKEEINDAYISIRLLFQYEGTNIGRYKIGKKCWVNILMNQYKPYPKGTPHNLQDLSEVYSHHSCKNCGKSYLGYKRQYLCADCINDDSIQIYPNFLISDMRFINEADAVKNKGGILIRINRNLIQNNYSTHESETNLDNYVFDHVIENDGTIDDLIKKVKNILIKEKII